MAESPETSKSTPESQQEAVRCYCQAGGLLDLLSRKYAMQVICTVGALEPVRYGEIEATFGNVSSSTLSDRLEELTDADIIHRTQYNEIPPRVEYELTPSGEELCELLEPILEWVTRNH